MATRKREPKPSKHPIVRQIVDRMHVGETDDAVRDHVRSKMKAAFRETKEAKKLLEDAVKHHHYNQYMYDVVMTGRFRGNPAIPGHMWVLATDSTGAYIITIGDPRRSGSKLLLRFSGPHRKREVLEWLKYERPRVVSLKHFVDETGLLGGG